MFVCRKMTKNCPEVYILIKLSIYNQPVQFPLNLRIYTFRMHTFNECFFLSLFFKDFIYFIFRERGREGEREAEKHQYVVVSHAAPTGDWPATQMCALTGWLFGPQAGTQSTEPYHPGLSLSFLTWFCCVISHQLPRTCYYFIITDTVLCCWSNSMFLKEYCQLLKISYSTLARALGPFLIRAQLNQDEHWGRWKSVPLRFVSL